MPCRSQHIGGLQGLFQPDAHHQPKARNLGHMGQCSQPGPQLGGALVYILQKSGGQQLIHHHIGTGAHHRVAAKGAAVAARAHTGGHGGAYAHRANGQPAAQPLGHAYNVRHKIVLLIGKQRAGAPHAGLHLVHNHQHIAAAAKLHRLGHIVFVQRHHAALALHHFHDHGAHIVGIQRGL